MTPLTIPETLPPHTRQWLEYLDNALAERAQQEGVSKIQLASGMVDRARGELHHMLHVYLKLAEQTP